MNLLKSLLFMSASTALFWRDVNGQPEIDADLTLWTAQDRLQFYVGLAQLEAEDWTVNVAGDTATQEASNSAPGVFCSNDASVQGKTITGILNPGSDDDFVGFAIGFNSGDSINPTADFLLVDWKRTAQTFDFGDCTPGGPASVGLAVSRVTGVPTGDELWQHADYDPGDSTPTCPEAANGGVTELARGSTLGSTGYDVNTNYAFTIDYSATNLVVSVDGTEELSISGTFPDGRVCFYSFVQGANAQTRPSFRDFTIAGVGQNLNSDWGNVKEDYVAYQGFQPPPAVPDDVGRDPAGQWDLSGSTSVTQNAINSGPTLFCSDFSPIGKTIQGTMNPGDDDDWVGFALGDPTNGASDLLLIDWKEDEQSINFNDCAPLGSNPGHAGLAVSRLTGPLTTDEWWQHTDSTICSSGVIEELARGTNLGSTGYTSNTDYIFTVEYSATELVVSVDGTEELRVRPSSGTFPDGNFCFFTAFQKQNNNQAGASYSNFMHQTPSEAPSSSPSLSQVPTCENGSSNAGCGGDPHFRTLGPGKRYSYHGEGDLKLLGNPDFRSDENIGLEIQIRTTIVHSKQQYYSIIEAAAIRMGNITLEVSPDCYYVNGKKSTELPITVYGNIRISKYSEQIKHLKRTVFEVDLAQDGIIKFTTFKNYVLVNVIDASEAEFANSVGMLGTYNEGSLLARDGVTVIQDMETIGDHWQVLGSEETLFVDLRAPKHPFEKPRMPPKNTSPSRRRLRATYTDEIAQAEQACVHRIEDNEECMFDVLATGDIDLAIGGEF